MATISRVPVVWTGGPGGTGLSVFHYLGSVADVSDLTTFFTAIAGIVPTGYSWAIPNTGDTLEDSTGTLTGTWTATGGGTVNASGGSVAYPAGTGARVRWNTNGIVNGRRVRGATFIAPMPGSMFDSAGTIATTQLNTLTTAAAALVTAGWPYVWSRPTPGGANGSTHAVVSSTVPDRVSSLRSRRT